MVKLGGGAVAPLPPVPPAGERVTTAAIVFPVWRKSVSKLSGVERFKSKSEIVYDFLKLNILNGKLKPDERIAVADIAKILSVSGIPIREALTKLEAEGLITITPHIGASVVKIDKIKLEEIHVIRTELEGLATQLACPCLKEEDFERLEQILTESEAAFAASDYKELTELNEAFHFTIYRSCPNKSLCKMITELLNKSRFASSSLVISESRAKNSIEEHRSILRALRANDAERASRIVKQQKRDSWATISKSIEENIQ
jgi:DNA-binding GntR family transcriptional regulator